MKTTMKHKLLAIGILALVLCATVPAAATAKPTTAQPKIVTYTVYAGTGDQFPPVQGSPIGSLSINLATGHFSLNVKVDPSLAQGGQDLYLFLVAHTSPDTWHFNVAYGTPPFTMVVTKTGVVHMSGTMAPDALHELQDIYSGQYPVKAADYGSKWWFFVDVW